MRSDLAGLSRPELQTLARLKAAATLRLAALAAPADAELGELARRGDFVLGLSAPGLPPARLACRAGALEVRLGPGAGSLGWPSLLLRFPDARACASLLGGGRGAVLPLPLGPGAAAALRYFRRAAARIPALLGDESGSAELRARLMAAAALQGVAEVGASDRSLAGRLAHLPDGVLAVSAPGSFAFCLERRGPGFSVREGAAEDPDARLDFADARAALAVLAGRRPAVVALGSGELSIRGYLPLVQGVFAVMDRLSDYLAVKSDEGGRDERH